MNVQCRFGTASTDDFDWDAASKPQEVKLDQKTAFRILKQVFVLNPMKKRRKRTRR